MKAVALLSVLAIWIGAAVIFIPQLAHRIGDRSSETSTTQTGRRRQDADGGDDGGRRRRGRPATRAATRATRAATGGAKGDKGGAGGGKGGTKQAADVPDDEIALTGTVAGDQPAGVRVSLEPTSLVDEDAQGGVGVGVPSSQLGNDRDEPRVVVPQPRAAVDPAGPYGDDHGGRVLGLRRREEARLLPADLHQARLPEAVLRDRLDQRGLGRAARGGPRRRRGHPVRHGDRPRRQRSAPPRSRSPTAPTPSPRAATRAAASATGRSRASRRPAPTSCRPTKPGQSSESRMVELVGRRHGDRRPAASRTASRASSAGSARSTSRASSPASAARRSPSTSEDGVVRTATTLTQGSRRRRAAAPGSSADFVGTYTVPGLPAPGTYVVTLSGPGLQTQTSKVTAQARPVAAGVDADLVAATGSVAGTITGLDTDGDTAGIVGAGLTLANADNTYKTMSTSAARRQLPLRRRRPGHLLAPDRVLRLRQRPRHRHGPSRQDGDRNRRSPRSRAACWPPGRAVQGRAVDGSDEPADRSAQRPVLTSAWWPTVLEPGVDDGTGDDHPTRPTSCLPTSSRCRTALTDPDGGLLPGLHTVTVSAPHYSSATAKVRVGNDQTVDVGTLALLPAPEDRRLDHDGRRHAVGQHLRLGGPEHGPLGTDPARGCDLSPAPPGVPARRRDLRPTVDTTGCAPTSPRAPATTRSRCPTRAPTPSTSSRGPEYVSPNPATILLESGRHRNQSYALNRLGE